MDAFTAQLQKIPARLDALKKSGYDPVKQPGFVAAWSFDKVTDNAFPPLPGSVATAKPVPLGEAKLSEGMNGRQAVETGPTAFTGTLDFASEMKDKPFTVSAWLKTKPGPFMGGYINVEGVMGSGFTQGNLGFNVGRILSDNWSSSMVSSWTHVVGTFDGQTLCAYRNGHLMSSVPRPENGKIGWGKKFAFGGVAYNDDPKVVAQSIYFYNTAFTPEAVESLYLWGKYGNR
jgi:hypothetical protein